eukprot:gnl/MRDRNA2_/MRDRNA2_254924_c0_seq1.p1 gnl/MRDRNA2_/MRDRNA2_254924_c0~~gnl/MRDRNA2_/MRDRNA2_254924_c0_seq1.p1  ORF type:complete len:120 (+),score=16.44 gnl/MRDRNA2_/MRDRNA2_254924_c0_seq1:46-405(+)
MEAYQVLPDVITCNAAIAACGSANQPAYALRLFDEFAHPDGRFKTIKPNLITHNAIISAFAGVGLWQGALNFLRNIRIQKLRPDVITFNSAMNACEKDLQWQKAVVLFEEMQGECIEPD